MGRRLSIAEANRRVDELVQTFYVSDHYKSRVEPLYKTPLKSVTYKRQFL